MGKVTLKDIAEKCGVSMMTVSRSLSPAHSHKLRPEVRELVERTAAKFGYSKNLAARRLKLNRACAISLMMGLRVMRGPVLTPDFDSHHEVISWGIVRGVITEARRHGYDVKIETLFEPGKCEEVISALRPGSIDGIIFNASSEQEEIIEFARSEGIPHLIMDYSHSYKGPEETAALMSNEAALRKAFALLCSKGHKKIGYIGCGGQVSGGQIMLELKKYLRKKRLFDNSLFYSVTDMFMLRELLDGFGGSFPFTALMCSNDTLADLTVRELRFAGARVPGDVAVVGYDGNQVYRRPGKTNPSTIRTPWGELASRSVEFLIEKIEGRRQGSPAVVEAEFMEGETT